MAWVGYSFVFLSVPVCPAVSFALPSAVAPLSFQTLEEILLCVHYLPCTSSSQLELQSHDLYEISVYMMGPNLHNSIHGVPQKVSSHPGTPLPDGLWQSLTLIAPTLCKKTSSSETLGSHAPFDLMSSYVPHPLLTPIPLFGTCSQTSSPDLPVSCPTASLFRKMTHPSPLGSSISSSPSLLLSMSPEGQSPGPGHCLQLSNLQMTNSASCIWLRGHWSLLSPQPVCHLLPSRSSLFSVDSGKCLWPLVEGSADPGFPILSVLNGVCFTPNFCFTGRRVLPLSLQGKHRPWAGNQMVWLAWPTVQVHWRCLQEALGKFKECTALSTSESSKPPETSFGGGVTKHRIKGEDFLSPNLWRSFLPFRRHNWYFLALYYNKWKCGM